MNKGKGGLYYLLVLSFLLFNFSIVNAQDDVKVPENIKTIEDAVRASGGTYGVFTPDKAGDFVDQIFDNGLTNSDAKTGSANPYNDDYTIKPNAEITEEINEHWSVYYNGKKGEKLKVTVKASGFETAKIYIFNANGKFILVERNDELKNPIEASLSLPYEGKYRIEVANESGKAGKFSMKLASDFSKVQKDVKKKDSLVEGKTYTLKELNSNTSTSTRKFVVMAYIKSINKTPDCPEGAYSCPLKRDYIVVTDKKGDKDDYSLVVEVYNFFSDNKLEIGKKYKMEISVFNDSATDVSDNSFSLMSLKLVGDGDTTKVNRFAGRVIIKVEDAGKAYYINPNTGMVAFLGRPADAFRVMREQGLGVTEKDFQAISSGKDMAKLKKLAGKIILRTQDKGQAYYINPVDLKLHSLGRPADAFAVIRKLGLGVNNKSFSEIVGVTDSAESLDSSKKKLSSEKTSESNIISREPIKTKSALKKGAFFTVLPLGQEFWYYDGSKKYFLENLEDYSRLLKEKSFVMSLEEAKKIDETGKRVFPEKYSGSFASVQYKGKTVYIYFNPKTSTALGLGEPKDSLHDAMDFDRLFLAEATVLSEIPDAENWKKMPEIKYSSLDDIIYKNNDIVLTSDKKFYACDEDIVVKVDVKGKAIKPADIAVYDPKFPFNNAYVVDDNFQLKLKSPACKKLDPFREKELRLVAGSVLVGEEYKNGFKSNELRVYVTDRTIKNKDWHSFHISQYSQRIYWANMRLSSDVDIDSFEVINDSYARDKNFVYYHYAKLLSQEVVGSSGELYGLADPETFIVLDSALAKDKTYVFRGPRIVSADASHFEKVFDLYGSFDNNYWKDSKYVYINDSPVENSDPSSFMAYGKNLDEWELNSSNRIYDASLAADKNIFYYKGQTCSFVRGNNYDDAQTFPGGYVKCGEKGDVFYIAPEKEKTPQCPKKYNNSDVCEIDFVYRIKKIAIPKADSETFEAFDLVYAKDKNNIYKLGVSQCNVADNCLPDYLKK